MQISHQYSEEHGEMTVSVRHIRPRMMKEDKIVAGVKSGEFPDKEERSLISRHGREGIESLDKRIQQGGIRVDDNFELINSK